MISFYYFNLIESPKLNGVFLLLDMFKNFTVIKKTERLYNKTLNQFFYIKVQ